MPRDARVDPRIRSTRGPIDIFTCKTESRTQSEKDGRFGRSCIIQRVEKRFQAFRKVVLESLQIVHELLVGLRGLPLGIYDVAFERCFGGFEVARECARAICKHCAGHDDFRIVLDGFSQHRPSCNHNGTLREEACCWSAYTL